MSIFSRRLVAIVTTVALVVSQHATWLPLAEVLAGAPPNASFTIAPEVKVVDQELTFDSSASTDPDNGPLQFQWDFNDGDGFSLLSSETVTYYNYETAGDKTVVLRVKDNEGLEDTIEQTFTVLATAPGNTAPVAAFSISPADGQGVGQGTSADLFTFNVGGSSDGQQTSFANLKFAWDWTNDGSEDTGFNVLANPANPVFLRNFSAEGVGTHTVRLIVEDDNEPAARTEKFGTVVISPPQPACPSNPNLAPSPSFTISPATGDTAQQFTFDASGSSDDCTSAASLEVRWDFENDGAWDTSFVTDKTRAHTFPTAGSYNIKLEVKDAQNATSTTVKPLTVDEPPQPPAPVNNPPTVVCAVNPTSGDIGASFNFDASNVSDDNTSVNALEVRWDFEGDGEYDTNFSPTKTTSHPYAAAGNITAKVQVRDAGDPALPGEDNCPTITVNGPNLPPTARLIVTPANMQGTVGVTEFAFDATGSTDAFDSLAQLQYSIDYGDGEGPEAYVPFGANPPVLARIYTTTGVKTVVLKVKDTGGLEADPPATVQVTVNPAPPDNTAPSASFTVSPADPQGNGQGSTADTFNFDASGSSDLLTVPANLRVRWDWNWGGNDDEPYDTGFTTTKTGSYKYDVDGVGTYTVRLEVEDEGGLRSTATRTVAVTALVPPPPGSDNDPNASFTISPADGVGNGLGDTMTMFVFDADGSSDIETPQAQLQVRWDFENDGTFDTTLATTKTATHTYDQPGTYTVKLEVKDGDNHVKDTVKQVTVTQFVLPGPEARTSSRALRRMLLYSNKAPQPVFEMSPEETAYVTETVVFDATKTTDDHDPAGLMMYRWDFDGDGEFDTRFSPDYRQTTYTYEQAGVKFITLEAFDTYGAKNSVTRLLEVVNKPVVVAPESRQEKIQLDETVPATGGREERPVLAPQAPAGSSAPVPATADGRHEFFFAPYITNRILRHGERTTLTISFMNVSDQPIFNARFTEELLPTTNGGNVLHDRPRFDGSTFNPYILNGTILGGDLTVAVVPPHSTLKMSYDIIGSVVGVPENQQSYVGSMFRYHNSVGTAQKSFLNSIILDNTPWELMSSDTAAAPSVLALSLAPLAHLSRRRREEEEAAFPGATL